MPNSLINVGFIPDGVRRWSKINGKSYGESYYYMNSVIGNIVDYFFLNGVHNLCIYMLSKENLRRKPEDLDTVLNAELDFFENDLPIRANKHAFSYTFDGALNLLPDWVNARLNSIPMKKKTNTRHLYLLFAYDPYEELISCLINKSIKKINSENLIASLWIPLQLDMVIRTSGEYRLSNFLPLQSGYAEIITLPKLVNDITQQDLDECVNEYFSRKRRFGE
jgi:undecaprenyl diphosphate synthase